MAKFEITEIKVCVVCIHLMANGEFVDGTDAADNCQRGQIRVWGEDAKYLTPGSEELGFYSSSCEGCGDDYHGDRHQAYMMIPKTGVEA